MPVTCGSVGDIIALASLARSIAKALNDSHGSSEEYRQVIHELWSLERALLGVEELSRTCGPSSSINALRQTALEYRSVLDAFHSKLDKYQRYLRDGGSSNVVKDMWWKIHWAVSFKEDLARFRASVLGHCSSIDLLLTSTML